jgi:hypothetical protein
MPSDETSVRLIAKQGLVEQLGYQIVEEEQKLRGRRVIADLS